MKKQFFMAILMFFIMASVQFSACEDTDNNNTQSSSCDSNVEVNTPENGYLVNAQVFGGMQGCGMVNIMKNGETISDAIVKLNGVTLPYEEDMGYASYLTNSIGDEIELEIIHEGSLISSGKVCLPGIPSILNIDSGDVHQKNEDLTINWASVEYATAIDVTIDENVNFEEYRSGFLPPNTTSHTVPSSFFNFSSNYTDTAECVISITAYNGISPGANYDNLDSADVGYNINGSAGVFIGLNGNDKTIYVPIND